MEPTNLLSRLIEARLRQREPEFEDEVKRKCNQLSEIGGPWAIIYAGDLFHQLKKLFETEIEKTAQSILLEFDKLASGAKEVPQNIKGVALEHFENRAAQLQGHISRLAKLGGEQSLKDAVLDEAKERSLLGLEAGIDLLGMEKGAQPPDEDAGSVKAPVNPGTTKFSPRNCGGVELCIAVSYRKDNFRDLRKEL